MSSVSCGVLKLKLRLQSTGRMLFKRDLPSLRLAFKIDFERCMNYELVASFQLGRRLNSEWIRVAGASKWKRS